MADKREQKVAEPNILESKVAEPKVKNSPSPTKEYQLRKKHGDAALKRLYVKVIVHLKYVITTMQMSLFC